MSANFLRRMAAGAALILMAGGVMTLVSFPGRAEGGRDGHDRGDGHDQGDGRTDQEKVLIGLRIAPVPLNMSRRDRNQVGLGSYLVNVGDCNGCHSAGAQTEFTDDGNPYLFAPPSQTMHMPKKVNPATYLGGGQDFGPFPAPNSPLHIYSRNLTPDITGKPAGLSLYEFMVILETGKDYDHLHPTCAAGTAQTASCVPYPFDGNLLQIMPWPMFQDMVHEDMAAIYAYLSAIPCIDTVVAGQPQLRNNCPK